LEIEEIDLRIANERKEVNNNDSEKVENADK
jgi:hypothetical protein